MKLITLTLMSALTCACAANPKPLPIPLNPADYQASTDQGLTYQQRVDADHAQSEADLTAQEEQRYNESVAKIEKQLDDERLIILMCTDTYGVRGKSCWILLQKFCVIDTVLDSRGDHHTKEYCGKEFLDYHNPNKH